MSQIRVKSRAAYDFFAALEKTITGKNTLFDDPKKPSKSMVSYWGNGNTFPQDFDAKANMVSVFESGINVLNQFTYGNGLFMYKLGTAEPGKERPIIEVKDEKIYQWLEASFIEKYLKEAIANINRYGNLFVRIMMSKDGKSIARIQVDSTPFCRLEIQNKTSLKIENVYLSSVWNAERSLIKSESDAQELKDRGILKFPLLDVYGYKEQIAKGGSVEYMIHLGNYTPGRNYYHSAPHHAAYYNGWFDIAAVVPSMKKAMFSNAMHLKYTIAYDETYFQSLYGDEWAKKEDSEKKKIRDDFFNMVDQKLTGAENAHKTIFYPKRVDRSVGTGQEIHALEITPVKNDPIDGQLVPDTQAANSEILFALGVDPALLGAGVPSGKLTNGSGSDKREAQMLLVARQRDIRDLVLAPIYMAADINGFDKEVYFGFKDIVLTTLDVNPTGSQKQGG